MANILKTVTDNPFDGNVNMGASNGLPLDPIMRLFGQDIKYYNYWSTTGPTTAVLAREYGDLLTGVLHTNTMGGHLYCTSISQVHGTNYGPYWSREVDGKFRPGIEIRNNPNSNVSGVSFPEVKHQLSGGSGMTSWTVGMVISLTEYSTLLASNWNLFHLSTDTGGAGSYYTQLEKDPEKTSSPQAGLKISFNPQFTSSDGAIYDNNETFHVGGGDASLSVTGVDAADIDMNPTQMIMFSFDSVNGVATGLQIGLNTLSEATNFQGESRSGYTANAFTIGDPLWLALMYGGSMPTIANTGNDNKYSYHESWCLDDRALTAAEMRLAARLTAEKWNALG